MASTSSGVCNACSVRQSSGAWRDDLSPFAGQAKDVYSLIVSYADLRLCPGPSRFFRSRRSKRERDELVWTPQCEFLCLWLMHPNSTCVLEETAWLQDESGTAAQSIGCVPGLYYVYCDPPQLSRRATLVLHSDYALTSALPESVFEEHPIRGDTSHGDGARDVYLLVKKCIWDPYKSNCLADRLVASGKGVRFDTNAYTGGSWTVYVTRRDHRMFAAYLHY